MATVRVGLAKPAGIKLQHSLGGLGPHDPAAGGAATFRSLTLTSRSSLFFSKLSIDRNTENIQGPRSVVAVHPSCISTGGQSPVVARASNAGGRDAARPSMTLGWSWIWRATLCRGRMPSASGRDRSASLQEDIARPDDEHVGPRSVVAVHPMPADATAARPSIGRRDRRAFLQVVAVGG